MNYTNKDLFEETSKKLEVLQKRQLASQQYFNKRENYNKMTTFIDTSLKSKIKSNKQNSEIDEKVISKLTNLLKNLAIAEDKNLLSVNSLLTKKINESAQTEGDEIELNLKKMQDLEKENENLNSPGMHFQPLAFSQSCINPDSKKSPDANVNRFYAYGVVARLALLAAAYELAAITEEL